MQPKVEKHNKLYITGITGNGNQTGDVWSDFEARYDSKPFPKKDEHGYEIRFYDAEKPAPKDMDIHVGFLTANSDCSNDFTTIELPAAEYAIFDVCITNGYDSGNAAMDKWLADNAMRYKPQKLDGVSYIIEVYNEKFANSIVEFWVPVCAAAKDA